MSDSTEAADLGPEWWEAARRSDLSAEAGQVVRIDGRVIALFLHDGSVYATDDSCPHAGAPLSEGHVENGIVTCPWHAWRFCITDGHWADVPKSKTRLTCYETRLVGDKVFVRVPPRGSQPDGTPVA